MIQQVVLMRGTSGAGKSTWVKEHLADALVLSSDERLTVDGEFVFDRTRLKGIHQEMVRDVRDALRREVPLIVVDKCNISLAAMRPFLRAARFHGASVLVVTLHVDPLTAWRRSTHGASARVVQEMASRLARVRIPSWVEHQQVRA